MTAHEPSLRDRLKVELKAAMRSKDRVVLAALRSALAAIDNAEAVDSSLVFDAGDSPIAAPIAASVAGVGSTEVVRRELSVDDVFVIVAGEIGDLLAGAVDYERLGQADAAADLRIGAAVLTRLVEADGGGPGRSGG